MSHFSTSNRRSTSPSSLSCVYLPTVLSASPLTSAGYSRHSSHRDLFKTQVRACYSSAQSSAVALLPLRVKTKHIDLWGLAPFDLALTFWPFLLCFPLLTLLQPFQSSSTPEQSCLRVPSLASLHAFIHWSPNSQMANFSLPAGISLSQGGPPGCPFSYFNLPPHSILFTLLCFFP